SHLPPAEADSAIEHLSTATPLLDLEATRSRWCRSPMASERTTPFRSGCDDALPDAPPQRQPHRRRRVSTEPPERLTPIRCTPSACARASPWSADKPGS